MHFSDFGKNMENIRNRQLAYNDKRLNDFYNDFIMENKEDEFDLSNLKNEFYVKANEGIIG